MSCIADLLETEREQIGWAWLEAGLGEHASVAAFARFVLHLMTLGAPAELVREAIHAMDDEVEHARLCFGIAKMFTGRVAGPGPIDLTGVFDQPNDSRSILEAAILEGCIAETISARCAQAALDLVADPTIHGPLSRIASDESKHADLSWHFVAWMLEKYPELKTDAAEFFDRALANPGTGSGPGEDECEVIERFGHLRPASRVRVAAKVVQHELRPRKEALMQRFSAGS